MLKVLEMFKVFVQSPSTRLLRVVLLLCFATEVFAFTNLWTPARNLSEVEYAAGTSLAKSGEYEAAAAWLKAGWARTGDVRFLSQLAGVSYRNGNQEQAKKYLHEILRLHPLDPYANEFLGTIFLLEKNLEAALKYWNRLNKPLIERVQLKPVPPVDPEMMDRVLSVAPLSQLKTEDYLATESRMQMTGIFKKQEFVLKPHSEDEGFDLIVSPVLRKSSNSSKMKLAGLAAEALFSETVTPEFINIGGSTITSDSLISWDEYKNRYYTSLSFPFGNRPHLRIRFYSDTRKETWAFASDVDLLRSEGGIEFGESVSGRWSWNSGTRASYRTYDNSGVASEFALKDGWLLEAFGNVRVFWIRIPERRFTLSTITESSVGRAFGSSSIVSTVENSLELRWFPRATGEDLAMHFAFRMGKLFGNAPLDSYFVLGVERDSDLKLRAHKSSIDPKGENPFAPAYLLWNWEISKTVFEKRGLRFRVVPFFDAGRISDSELWNGEYWFADTGIQAGFQLHSSVELLMTYGKDLRTGRNVFYVSAKL